MSILDHFNDFLQKLRKVRLPEFQAELERANFENIKSFLPSSSLAYAQTLLSKHPVTIEISKARGTKQGDFRPPPRGRLPKITINNDLNPYSFLITFIHEWAHLLVYENFNRKVPPHGKEWKSTYQLLLSPLMEIDGLDESFKYELQFHLARPKASTLGDTRFAKFLKSFDTVPAIHLEDLEEGSLFQLNNGLILTKGVKRRTRYLCQEWKSHKKYTVHGLAEVKPVKVQV